MTHASVGDMFVEHLFARVPELAAVRDEHIRAVGEVFPHMILPDVASFITARSEDVHLVDAVPHAHDLELRVGLEVGVEPALNFIRPADARELFERFFVGPAVQWPG